MIGITGVIGVSHKVHFFFSQRLFILSTFYYKSNLNKQACEIKDPYYWFLFFF
jgi:hypothetical protein